MKSVRFHKTGDPASVLEVEESEAPEPGPNEIRVRVLASPINPADLLYIRGAFGRDPQLPATPGFEGVGVVEQGDGLMGRFLKGKRVAILNRERGNWSEQTVLPANKAIPLDSSISVEQAACFFVNPATSWVMTRSVLNIPRGGWLLQTAAGSSLGRMIIRLGQHYGFRTLCIVRREQQVEEVRALGATEAIAFDDGSDPAELHARALELVPGGVRFAIDPVGGHTGSAVIGCLGHGARLLAYGTMSPDPLTFSGRALMTRAASVEGFWLSNHMNSLKLPGKLRLIRNITRLIKAGVLTTDIDSSFGLSDVRDAVAAATREGRAGKVILRPNQS